MALSPANSRASTGFRGLEQFHTRGDADGVGYCIAGAKPYALEFSNNRRCHLSASWRHQQQRPNSRTIAKSRWCFWASPRPFIRASAMCGCAPTTCAMALSLSAMPGISRAFSTIAASSICGRTAAATISATTPSSFWPAM